MISMIFGCSAKTTFRPIETGSSDKPENHMELATHEIINTYKIPGIQFAYIDAKGLLSFSYIQGTHSFTRKTDITNDHLMHIGSATKMFTAMSVMRLVKKGSILLGTTIDSWFPSYTRASDVTVEMLLNHSSGLKDMLTEWRFLLGSYLAKDKVWDGKTIVGHMQDKNLGFKPETQFEYSNTNYLLFGLILEQELQQPLKRIYRDLIFTSSIHNTAVFTCVT